VAVTRKELLAKEKELTRQRDELNTDRRNLPMVEVTKEYVSTAHRARYASSSCSRVAGS